MTGVFVFVHFLFCGVDGVRRDTDNRFAVNLESRRAVKFDSYVVPGDNLCHLRVLYMLALENRRKNHQSFQL